MLNVYILVDVFSPQTTKKNSLELLKGRETATISNMCAFSLCQNIMAYMMSLCRCRFMCVFCRLRGEKRFISEFMVKFHFHCREELYY